MRGRTPWPRFRKAMLLWSAGMTGVAILTITALPRLLGDVALPVPLSILMLASLAQSALLLALATWAGVAFAPALGLSAPAFEAAAMRQSVTRALRPQISLGLIAGGIGGMLLFFLSHHMPAALAAAQTRFNIPILARILYGGLTEELLLRWGVMTTLLWLLWRFVQRRLGLPRPTVVWLAIVTSALLFGAGHLPAAATLIGHLSGELVLFVVTANALLGVLFGYLFWRRGLETAMIAHGLSHLVQYLLALL